MGARVDLEGAGLAGADLFSETQARALVACRPAAAAAVLREAEEAGVPAAEIGAAGGETLEMRTGGELLRAPVEVLRERWATALPRALGL